MLRDFKLRFYYIMQHQSHNCFHKNLIAATQTPASTHLKENVQHKTTTTHKLHHELEFCDISMCCSSSIMTVNHSSKVRHTEHRLSTEWTS